MISGRLKAAYRALVSSYAFIPGCFITAGVITGAGLATLDNVHGEGWISDLPIFVGPATPDGARGILTTVGGSMLSVAGIVFSITLAAIVFASGQYGPHVLPQYRRDRFAQSTLGVMLAVFAYTMAVLYAVQGGDSVLVPRLAVVGALVLTAAGMVMLVLFIAHMLGMLHVSNIVARIGSVAMRLMDREMPEPQDTPPKETRAQSPIVGHDAGWLTKEGDYVLRANGTGYVLTEATAQLVGLAQRRDIRIDVLVRPGDYVTPLTPVLRLSEPIAANDEAVCDQLRSALAYGNKRTPDEDVAFMLDELCAVGLRALSPGINDPFTATDVINQLTAVTERAARGRPLDAFWRDKAGEARVRRPVLTFGDVVRLGFDRMASDAATNVTVAPVMAAAYDSLLAQMDDGANLTRLRGSARRFEGLCQECLPTDEAKKEARRHMTRILDRSNMDVGPGELRARRIVREDAA